MPTHKVIINYSINNAVNSKLFKKIHISLMAGGSDLAAKEIKEMLV